MKLKADNFFGERPKCNRWPKRTVGGRTPKPKAAAYRTRLSMLRASNDDKGPMIDLLNCVDCQRAMKLEKSVPHADGGGDLVQYRCKSCHRIERVTLLRRNASSEM